MAAATKMKMWRNKHHERQWHGVAYHDEMAYGGGMAAKMAAWQRIWHVEK
jgi:hypothetical protein